MEHGLLIFTVGMVVGVVIMWAASVVIIRKELAKELAGRKP